jgi:hypothetical protein
LEQFKTTLYRDTEQQLKIAVVASIEQRHYDFVIKQLVHQSYQDFDDFIYIDKQPATGIEARRKRIARNQQLLKRMMLGHDVYDYVIQIEGDSVLEPDTFKKMIKLAQFLHKRNDSFGYLSGVQIGRHGLYCIGAWHVAANRRKFQSINHKLTGLQKVDATGFYCFIAPYSVWMRGMSWWEGERWGPDVNYGLSLREQGFTLYVDMDLQIPHATERGQIDFDNINLCTVAFEKQADGLWKHNQL